MRVCLFEDQAVAGLEPLVLTRPVFELLCGRDSLRNKHGRYLASWPFTLPSPPRASESGWQSPLQCGDGKAPIELGALIRPYLALLYRLQEPHIQVNDLAWLRAGSTVLVNGRWLPPFPQQSLPPALDSPCVAMIGDEVAYAVVSVEQLAGCSPNTLLDCLESWKNDLPRRLAGGCLIRHAWDLIERNGEQLIQDFQLTAEQLACRPQTLPGQIGPAGCLRIEPSARLDPMVVADTTQGPVVIEREAVIHAFSRLEGPCYIGARSHVLGAKIRAGTTIGPDCRVGGEVEASILHGNTNKYHDGFLGHSYVGEWVNFGAGTQSSDLRNDYGEVAVPVGGRLMATGLSKVGCFIGDHTKTGLGALMNTGTSTGVFCNLLPCGGLLPKYFPSFSTCRDGTLAPNSSLPQLLETASEVMRRRGATLTEPHAALFRYLFDLSAAERLRLYSTGEQRPTRRSA